MQAQKMFSAITNTMTNALDQFVQTGKLNFGDLAKSIINDLLKIELQAQEMKLFAAMGGGFGGLFSGGLFAGGASTPGGAYSADFMTAAGGGDLTPGMPAIVGENGPELVIPQTGGTVVPNNKLADVMGGGQGNGITYNGPYIASMSAIDTQSATQFLAANQNAVWGAYQNAQRGLPQTR
jgi:phage-related minor tail protein